uniref:Sushi domain containing 1 n=1 Tax=Gadus morhua TaxID=8049 RepID=A0A8C5FG16_GADMO
KPQNPDSRAGVERGNELQLLILLIRTASSTGPAGDICASCHANATCSIPQDGSGHVCICMYGFIGNGRTLCQDKDECQIGARKICGPRAACHNTVGSYACTCMGGFRPSNHRTSFTPNDGTYCQDIDECGRHPAVCGEGARCVNLEGDFECRCLLGYRAHNASDPLQPLRDKGSCKVVDCGPPPAGEAVRVLSTNGTAYGSVVLMGCKDGFLWRRGDNSSTCGPDGTWSRPAPLCQEIQCGEPLSKPHARMLWDNGTRVGSVLHYQCEEGYRPSTNRHSPSTNRSVCGEDGQWEESDLRCEGIVVFRGTRDYQGAFRHEKRQLLHSWDKWVEVCLSLLPATNYTISVIALSTRFTANITTNTSLQGNTVVFFLGCSVYQVVVVPLDGTVVFDCRSRGIPGSSQGVPPSSQYITGQFPLGHMNDTEMIFTVGDGRFHGGFLNAPLKRGTSYYVILRVVSQWKEAGHSMGFKSTLEFTSKYPSHLES